MPAILEARAEAYQGPLFGDLSKSMDGRKAIPHGQIGESSALKKERQAATKHLELLQAVGVVSSAKRGRERIWTVQPEPLAAASDYLTVLSRRWDSAIERLTAFVED